MRRIALLTLVSVALAVVCCEPWAGIRVGSPIEADAELTIWADHMPVVPPGNPDRVYAFVDIQFRNGSDYTVIVEVERLLVVCAGGTGAPFGFALEQTTDWGGVLAPGEAGGGQWSKSEQITEPHPPCGSEVFGVVRVRAVREDGEPLPVRRTVTPAARFLCTQ